MFRDGRAGRDRPAGKHRIQGRRIEKQKSRWQELFDLPPTKGKRPMRKVLIGILLLLATLWIPQAEAQTGDPVTLIASAAILPFWATAGNFTVFELTSLSDNTEMHAFFFNASCNRVFSMPFAMSEHDALVVFSDELGLDFNGLMAVARSSNNITAIGLQSPITARSHKVNIAADTIGIADAIGARVAEDQTRIWNPLRSAASTITFPGDQTRWWFVCPSNHVVVDLGGGIPSLPPGPALIRFRAYDLDEEPLFDGQLTCSCLTEINPTVLYPFMFGTQARYVEMVTYVSTTPMENPPSFVLYRQLKFTAPGGFNEDDLARAPGMSAATLFTGTPVQGAR